MSDEAVVVTTNLRTQRRRDGRMFAAHLDGLGLTAYGRTAKAARENVNHLFNTWVSIHRQLGALESRLNELGVEWYPSDEYRGTLAVEYTSPSEAIARSQARSVDDRPQYDASHDDEVVAVAA